MRQPAKTGARPAEARGRIDTRADSPLEVIPFGFTGDRQMRGVLLAIEQSLTHRR